MEVRLRCGGGAAEVEAVHGVWTRMEIGRRSGEISFRLLGRDALGTRHAEIGGR